MRTQQHYKSVIRQFVASLRISFIEDLTSCHIDQYISNLLGHAKNRTGNAHLTAIKSFCHWLAKNYDIPNPAASIDMLKEDPPIQRCLTYEEYKRVLSVCSEQEADLIRFLGNTGLRATEAINLTWDSIDGKWLKVVGKGRKFRTIPLNVTARSVLAKYPHQPTTPINFIKSTRMQLYRLCCRLAIKAEIPRFGPHALRHYFATELLRRGVPISYVSQILGHSSIKTTESIYIHFKRSYLDGITDVLDD